MKKLKNFILDLLIAAIVGFLLSMYIDDSRIRSYQDCFLRFNWFQPLLIRLAGLFILVGLILVLGIFKPTHRKPGFYKNFNSGHIYVSREVVEKTVYGTIARYDQVKQPNVISKLYNKKNKSFINIRADFFVPNHVQVKSLTGSIRADIRSNVERLAEISVRRLEVNIRNQETPGPRVL